MSTLYIFLIGVLTTLLCAAFVVVSAHEMKKSAEQATKGQLS